MGAVVQLEDIGEVVGIHVQEVIIGVQLIAESGIDITAAQDIDQGKVRRARFGRTKIPCPGITYLQFIGGIVAEPGIQLGNIDLQVGYTDRKSTRLNSSHQIISYAVFCLKKKKKKT